MLRDRTLRWDGCVNVRDLGGHPTEDGGTTVYGAVVRADNVRRLTDGGWRQLRDYGVRRIVDLRYAAELDEDPPGDVDVEVVHLSLLGAEPGALEEIDQRHDHLEDPVEWKHATYAAFLDRFADNFAAAVSAIASAPEGGVLVHCAGGVDRTGLVAALVLRLAGVGVDDVAADYALSQASWAPSSSEWIAAATDETERRRRRLLSVMPAEAMRRVLADVEASNGGAAGYLRRAGVPDADLDRVRSRLRS